MLPVMVTWHHSACALDQVKLCALTVGIPLPLSTGW